jgi:hypothetical protein
LSPTVSCEAPDHADTTASRSLHRG